MITDIELMQDALKRINNYMHNKWVMSFDTPEGLQPKILINGEQHAQQITNDETLAFLDGFETALELVCGKYFMAKTPNN